MTTHEAPSAELDRLLDSEAFNAVMYRYRMAPTTDPKGVLGAFEAVQQFLRDELRQGPASSITATKED